MTTVVVEATHGVVVDNGQLKEGKHYIVVEDGIIQQVTGDLPAGKEVTLSAAYVFPGFVDIHNHGLGGADDVARSWTNPEHTLQRLPAMGVTDVLASLLPMDRESYAASLEALLPLIAEPGHGAICAGIHAEGPVIRDAGALPDQNLNPSLAEFTQLIDMCKGHMKVMTISPSVDVSSNFERTRALLERDVRVALGHDKHATADDIVAAMRIARQYGDGLVHITHIFNVSKFHHRETSLVNFGLCPQFPNSALFEDLAPPTVEVIGDGLHVDSLTLSTLLGCRRPKDVAFITDNILHGEPGLQMNYCGRALEVGPSGKGVYVQGTQTLAGSCLSLWDCFRFLVKEQRQSLGAACAMLSTTPARIARLPRTGSITPNNHANLLLASPHLDLHTTLVAGRAVYTARTQ